MANKYSLMVEEKKKKQKLVKGEKVYIIRIYVGADWFLSLMVRCGHLFISVWKMGDLLTVIYSHEGGYIRRRPWREMRPVTVHIYD